MSILNCICLIFQPKYITFMFIFKTVGIFLISMFRIPFFYRSSHLPISIHVIFISIRSRIHPFQTANEAHFNLLATETAGRVAESNFKNGINLLGICNKVYRTPDELALRCNNLFLSTAKR